MPSPTSKDLATGVGSLPERILNHGLDLVDPAILEPGEIPFGTRTTAQPALLRLHKLPNILTVDTSGRSAFLRTLITQACALGWRVAIVDPKDTWTDFAGWPGIDAIAVTGEDREKLMLQLKQEMDQKHQLLAAGLIRADQLVPVLAVVDETAADRATWSRARKGRQSRDQLVIGTQRPDLSFIPGEARDNMTNRIAVGRLKPHEVAMVFGRHQANDLETRTLSEGQIPGCAIVDIGNGIEAVQVWWTPDPTEATDPDELAALQQLRDQAQTALELRLAEPDHFGVALDHLQRGETGPLGQAYSPSTDPATGYTRDD